MKTTPIKRILEIIPGLISWSLILGGLTLSVLDPLRAAIAVIVYLLFWVCRLFYMSVLLVLAHHKMLSHRQTDWLKLCDEINSDKNVPDIVHAVLYAIYNEPPEVIRESLRSIKNAHYPHDQILVTLAGEARRAGTKEILAEIQKEFAPFFKEILVTLHPDKVSGESPCKGANATFAAKQIAAYLTQQRIPFSNVLLSCFDADTCPDKNYFSCLTYHFLANPKRHRMSFQPLPIYSNNIYSVPAFARIIEVGSTFWQLMESMRHEKFVTFSSHSMSFQTLVDVDYWPVDMVSDDSLIFWKCFLKFNGDYVTQSLEVPVYMDIAVGRNILHTVAVQYKQKRRWAWGVETFVFVGEPFLTREGIPFSIKARKLFQILDSHINWATWSIILSFMTPFLLMWGKAFEGDALVFFNLTYINSVIFNSLAFILILCMVISKEFIPPRPPQVSRWIYVSFMSQWLFLPLVSAFLGSFPALDAQTRLMFRKDLPFFPTPKQRDSEGKLSA